MKIVIGMMLVFGAIATFLWSTVPRLVSDVWHFSDFVPAQSYTITDYKCTNVNGFMWNHCSVTFVSRQSGESREITDWRFGRAPSDPIQLLQRRGDASSVTTDVSLRTLWNRMLVVLMLVLFVAALAFKLIADAFKGEDDAPAGTPNRDPAPSRDPSPEPMGRSTFGKRHA